MNALVLPGAVCLADAQGRGLSHALLTWLVARSEGVVTFAGKLEQAGQEKLGDMSKESS